MMLIMRYRLYHGDTLGSSLDDRATREGLSGRGSHRRQTAGRIQSEFGELDDNRASSAKSLGCLQVVRQVLPQTRAAGHATDLALLLHHGKFNCGAIGEMIENLLGPPPPGMMFAHERAGGVHRALIVRIASILVEDVWPGPNRPATPDRTRPWAGSTHIRRSGAGRPADASLPPALQNTASPAD